MDIGMGKDNVIFLGAKILFAVFAILFFAYPLLLVLSKAATAATFGKAISIILSKQGVLYSSLLQAAASTIVSLLIGLPAAYIIARRTFPGKKLVRAASLIPFVFPSILVVLSFVIVFGNNGWVNSVLRNFLGFTGPVQFLYGFWGVVLAHAFYNFPLVMRLVGDSWERLGSQTYHAARSLGASRFSLFVRVLLPQLLPSIAAVASLVFIYCFMSFAVVLSLGGPGVSTFEVEIYQQAARNLDIGTAAVLAAFQFALLSIPAAAYFVFSRKAAPADSSAPLAPKKFNLSKASGILEAAFMCSAMLFLMLPVFSLFIFAFTDSQTGAVSLRSFTKIFSAGPSITGATAMSSIFYSLALALAASIVATLMGLIATLRQTRIPFMGGLVGASVAISVLTLALGYYIGFGPGSLLVIAIAHSVLAFPFACRIIGNALQKVDAAAIDAARTLGASPFAVLSKIQLPSIKKSIFASFAFSFAVSLGELGLVLTLYDGIYPTMPVYIYRLVSVFDIGAAAAMGLILATVSFMCFYAIEHFSEGQVF
ncbi:MAG TPA: iron ABC transporter permease [archaeon]|nr:iron ABC transporter permease [archaeon]